MSIDLPLPELLNYRPPLTKAPDFEEFWAETLAELRAQPLELEVSPIPYPPCQTEFFHVFYQGFRGARIAGYLARPRERTAKIPCVLVFHGYSGSKPPLWELLKYTSLGWAALAVDTRGQNGEATNTAIGKSGHVSGWMTVGIEDKEEYYYRGAYADCVRAYDVAASLDFIDPGRVAATGGSQGGGLTIAVAALEPRLKAYAPNIAYLCHFERAVQIAANGPYREIETYLRRWPEKERQVFATLSYFDGMNLASLIKAPGLWSVGINDDICPPSTTIAAFHHAGGAKELRTYRYCYHEVPETHEMAKIRWLAEKL